MLTEKEVKAVRSGEKNRLIADGGGLFLLVSPAGGKSWQYRYRFVGKEKTLSLGRYPLVSLAKAREMHIQARLALTQGHDPAAQKKALKAEATAHAETEAAKAKALALTVAKVVQQWLEKSEPGWSPVHIRDTRQKLDRYILPRIGEKPIAEIGRREVKEILDTLDAGGKIPTLKKVRGIIGQIFQFAINQEISGVKEDPTLYLRGKGVFTTHIVRHRSALTEPKDIGALMSAIENYADSELRTKIQTALALKFSALTFCRPGEISKAEWSEIKWDRQLWIIPTEKMKARKEHLVPLARQTLDLLTKLKPITGHSRYLFHSERADSRPMSAETVNAALRRMGVSREEMTSHGFRRMASTRLNEHGWNADWIEMQLAHSDKNKIRSFYNSALYLDGRREMMQWWADYLTAYEPNK